MSLLSHPPEEVVLASEMRGHITLHNKPAAGAKIIRKIAWIEGSEIVETVSTDNDGMFVLPENRNVIEIGKFTQFVVSQKISVTYASNETDIWIMGARGKSAFREFGGRPENLLCELSDPDLAMRMDSGLLLTKCKWNIFNQSKN